jgi:hypothetical protein
LDYLLSAHADAQILHNILHVSYRSYPIFDGNASQVIFVQIAPFLDSAVKTRVCFMVNIPFRVFVFSFAYRCFLHQHTFLATSGTF